MGWIKYCLRYLILCLLLGASSGAHALPATGGVIDRFVGSTSAVILLGEEEGERVVDLTDLPVGAVEGDWVQVSASGEVTLDKKKTAVQWTKAHALRRHVLQKGSRE